MRHLFFFLTLFSFMGLGAPAMADHAAHGSAAGSQNVTYRPDITFTLRTEIADGKLGFVGETGDIKDKVNPDLKVAENAVVQINLINSAGAIHDIAVPEFNAQSDQIVGKGAATVIVFRATKGGTFEYLCTLPGHK